MFKTKYACITSFADGGEFVSVRLCKGTQKALSLLEECVEEEKIFLGIKPGDGEGGLLASSQCFRERAKLNFSRCTNRQINLTWRSV